VEVLLKRGWEKSGVLLLARWNQGLGLTGVPRGSPGTGDLFGYSVLERGF